MIQFLNVFWDYIVLSAPYLWLGILVSGIVHQFLPAKMVHRWMSGGKISQIFKAAFIGVPLPLCSCAVIPTSITLRKMGASKSATSAFLISTPESGIDSMMVTYGLMDIPMTFIRPIAAFLSAILAGLSNYFFEKKETLKPILNSEINSTISMAPKFHFKNALRFALVDLMDDMVGWLFVGLFCGALITWFVPEDFFLNISPFMSKLGITIIATLFYICASASTPLAASLIMKGMSPGTALILLLLGPATNISNIIIMQKYLGKRTILINLISIITVALIGSFIVDYGYQNWWNLKDMKIFLSDHGLHEHTTHSQHSLFATLCAIGFIFLMAASMWRVFFRPYLVGAKNQHGHDLHEHHRHHDHANSCCDKNKMKK